VKRDRIFREKSFLFNLLPLAEEFKWAHLYRYLILNGSEKKSRLKSVLFKIQLFWIGSIAMWTKRNIYYIEA